MVLKPNLCFYIFQVLESRGYLKLTVQQGRGKFEVKNSLSPQFSVSSYRYKDSLSEDIKNADLVISHAGKFITIG